MGRGRRGGGLGGGKREGPAWGTPRIVSPSPEELWKSLVAYTIIQE